MMNPYFRTPPVVKNLIIINTLVFLADLRILGVTCQHFEFLCQQLLICQKIVQGRQFFFG